jgi:flavin reductase (DIM6/NTAB) family NADH-FMN oxidoreductase RutF
VTTNNGQYREAMRTLAGGVVVLTTWIDERPWGMTISACCSVSASPPRVLVSVSNLSRCHSAIKATGRFGVNILRADQKHIAEFASAPAQPKFLDTLLGERCMTLGTTTPRLADALAHLDCVISHEVDVTDHTLMIGEVHGVTVERGARRPLIYFDRGYRQMGEHL